MQTVEILIFFMAISLIAQIGMGLKLLHTAKAIDKRAHGAYGRLLYTKKIENKIDRTLDELLKLNAKKKGKD